MLAGPKFYHVLVAERDDHTYTFADGELGVQVGQRKLIFRLQILFCIDCTRTRWSWTDVMLSVCVHARWLPIYSMYMLLSLSYRTGQNKLKIGKSHF
jgi:hypothetical protein